MNDALLLALAAGGGGGGGGGGSAKLTETTYSDLKDLRDNGNLVPGMYYRITDYVTKINGTIRSNGMYLHYAKSAEHPYDIIVCADSSSTLNENAWAIQHQGDTYFNYANLAAWELKYTLDNDASKYAWADTANGKGVVYYMKDEWNNEAWYDFKNAMFLRYEMIATNDDIASINYTRTSCHFGTPLALVQKLLGQTLYNGLYDFAVGALIMGAVQAPTVDDTYLSTYHAAWYYTFDWVSSDYAYVGEHFDMSTKTSDGGNTYGIATNNRFAPCEDYFSSAEGLGTHHDIMGLPCNVIETNDMFAANPSRPTEIEIGPSCWYNTIGPSPYIVKLEKRCTGNIIGGDCHIIMLSDDCHNTVIGSSSSHIVFTGACQKVVIGYACTYFHFDHVLSVTADYSCSYITLERDADHVDFGHDCFHIFLGEHSDNCTFGNDCSNISLGTYCEANTFGSYCFDIELGPQCQRNTFGNSADTVKMETRGTDNVLNGGKCYLGEGCAHITTGANCHYITFVDYCEYIELSGTMYYYRFAEGTRGTSATPITIAGSSYNTYVTNVALNSSGVLKTWCEADLAP